MAAILFLLVADLVALWLAGRGGKWLGRSLFSPFVLGSQAVFATLAVLHVGPKAFEGFVASEVIGYGELSFFALMLLGIIAGWGQRPE